jgi:LacI family transcriptional regulator
MTIVAIAESVGVSKSTVSRVINNRSGVRPEVAKAVRARMDDIGYRPPTRRRGPQRLAKSGVRTGNLLLLSLGYTSAELYRMPVFPHLLHGLESAVREAGLNLVVASADPGGVIPAALDPNRCDGVLLVGRPQGVSEPITQRLSNLPVVVLMRSQFKLEQPHDRVLYHNQAVGQLAARHLIERGHRRLAYFNIHTAHTAYHARQAAFIEAAEAEGCSVAPLQNESGSQAGARSTTAALVRQWRLLRPRPTGMFVISDHMLGDLYHEMRQAGLEPDRDVDVISCDNEAQFLDALHPRPATIDINLELVAKRGVDQLLWRLAHPQQESRLTVLIEPRVIPAEFSIPAD